MCYLSWIYDADSSFLSMTARELVTHDGSSHRADTDFAEAFAVRSISQHHSVDNALFGRAHHDTHVHFLIPFITFDLRTKVSVVITNDNTSANFYDGYFNGNVIVKKKHTYMTIGNGDSRSLSNQYVVSRNSCSRFDNTIVTQLVVRCIGKGHPVFDRILLEIRLLDLLGSFIPRRICRFCRICSVKRMPEQP